MRMRSHMHWSRRLSDLGTACTHRLHEFLHATDVTICEIASVEAVRPSPTRPSVEAAGQFVPLRSLFFANLVHSAI